MGIDWQDKAATATTQTVVANVVVRERRVVVPHEETVLIPEVLHPVAKRWIIKEPEVVWTRPQAVVVAAIVAELGEVGVEERLRTLPIRCG